MELSVVSYDDLGPTRRLRLHLYRLTRRWKRLVELTVENLDDFDLGGSSAPTVTRTCSTGLLRSMCSATTVCRYHGGSPPLSVRVARLRHRRVRESHRANSSNRAVMPAPTLGTRIARSSPTSQETTTSIVRACSDVFLTVPRIRESPPSSCR